MPKGGKKGGKKGRRGGRKFRDDSGKKVEKAEESQGYGRAVDMVGGCKVRVELYPSNRKMICNIRGKMRKRVWIARDDILLISYREYQDDKAEIIGKYNHHDVSQLIKLGEITDTFVQGITDHSMNISSFDMLISDVNKGGGDDSDVSVDSFDVDEI